MCLHKRMKERRSKVLKKKQKNEELTQFNDIETKSV